MGGRSARKSATCWPSNRRAVPYSRWDVSCAASGLSLGAFDSEAAANDELANLARRGIRTARVTQERAELRGSRLRLPAADDALKARMPEFTTALAGKPLKPCE